MATTNQYKKVAAFVMLIIGVFVGTLTAGDLNPPAAPTAGTMKTLDEVEPRIAVNDENTPGDATSVYRIAEPGSYYLTGNVFANGKHGVLIDADDVTLDLMGFRIWASYETADPPSNTSFDGIRVHDNGRNIEIRNGTIAGPEDYGYDGFHYGIYSYFSFGPLTYTRYLRIFNVRVLRSRSYGIMTNGYQVTIKDCHAAENGNAGIAVNWGVITNCVAYNNSGTGIYAGNCVVTQCQSTNNSGDGIYLGEHGVANNNSAVNNDEIGINASDNCVISRNTVDGNSGNGITAGVGCKIENNTVSENEVMGIEAGDACVITGNTVSNNTGTGISVGDGGMVDKNSAFGNGSYGIYTVTGCVVTNNTVYNNSTTGLYTGLTAVVKNNNAYENTGSGIYVSGYGSSVVGNTARNNQNHGIYVIGNCLVDQNAAYGNNQSGGSYVNLYTAPSCTVGINSAP